MQKQERTGGSFHEACFFVVRHNGVMVPLSVANYQPLNALPQHCPAPGGPRRGAFLSQARFLRAHLCSRAALILSVNNVRATGCCRVRRPRRSVLDILAGGGLIGDEVAGEKYVLGPLGETSHRRREIPRAGLCVPCCAPLRIARIILDFTAVALKRCLLRMRKCWRCSVPWVRVRW